jgi:Glycosyl hydrolases family 38 N-terminal domain
MKAPDITQVPTLYVIPYAHLDTQWRWEFRQTISEYLLKTMRVNFDYIDKYPHYVFNWALVQIVEFGRVHWCFGELRTSDEQAEQHRRVVCMSLFLN